VGAFRFVATVPLVLSVAVFMPELTVVSFYIVPIRRSARNEKKIQKILINMVIVDYLYFYKTSILY